MELSNLKDRPQKTLSKVAEIAWTKRDIWALFGIQRGYQTIYQNTFVFHALVYGI